jgi:hypothetical protein
MVGDLVVDYRQIMDTCINFIRETVYVKYDRHGNGDTH